MKDFAVNSDDIDTDSEEPETFDVKYLGCTIIDAVRSEEATAEAVHSVITTAKGECSHNVGDDVAVLFSLKQTPIGCKTPHPRLVIALLGAC